MRRFLDKYGVRAFGLTLVLLAALQSLLMFPSVDSLIQRVENAFYDLRMKAQPSVWDPRIVILNIDEKSIAEIGRWPWGRDVFADLIVKLVDDYKVSAIGFDVVFSEPDVSSGYDKLEAMAGDELKDVPAFGQRLKKLKPMMDYDGRLARALEGRPVVLGYPFSAESNAKPKGLLPDPVFTTADLDGRIVDAFDYTDKAYNANLPILQSAAKAGGFFSQQPDIDGVVRRVPLIMRVGDAYYESLALATTRVALGGTGIRPIFSASDDLLSEESRRTNGVLESIAIKTESRERKIPVQNYFETLIEFRGEGGVEGNSFRYVSAVDVLNGKIGKDELARRIVLVGTTVVGLNDNRPSPTNPNFPGVEMHANIVASLISGKIKIEPADAFVVNLIQILFVGLVLIFTLPSLSPKLSIIFAIGTEAVVVVFNFWMYKSFDLVLPVVTASLLILALFILNVAWGYLFEHRRGRAMVNLFGEYVSPELVAEMADDPESYSMEGESRELTVLFVDVRGFTTISEGLTPKALREYINIYLTAMSEDIRGNRGTLDKYIGDAVMAFWGAPVALPDHAARAVATALLMQSSAHKLNKDFMERGWPPLKIGIGLNTGQMHVGDMGSKVRRAYTVMGDAVNLGSRLEGITKEYGVGIVVGELTKLAAPEFAYRELDRVRVKGKNEPIPIFEPIAKHADLDEGLRVAFEQWHKALNLVRAMEWDQAESIIQELHRSYPDEYLYQLYIERIAQHRADPPEPGWDGVTTFKTK